MTVSSSEKLSADRDPEALVQGHTMPPGSERKEKEGCQPRTEPGGATESPAPQPPFYQERV